MPEPTNTKPNTSVETKPRGANRSTKVAGKLKVLPEQPEHLPVISTKSTGEVSRIKDHPESPGTAGDSDDGDIDENEESQEDIEVQVFFEIVHHSLFIRSSVPTIGLQPDLTDS
jgi:hypothetical protein